MKQAREQLADDLVRVGQGDVAAFVRLYHATSAKLFGIIVRILGRGDLANDILQDVYLRVWQRASDYNRELSSPVTWLASIARNRALDERRRRKLASIDEVPDLLVIASGEDVAGDYLAAEELKRLEKCLGTLDPNQRRAVELIYFDGLTREQVAESIGATVSTVRSSIQRGLAVLKRCLGHV